MSHLQYKSTAGVYGEIADEFPADISLVPNPKSPLFQPAHPFYQLLHGKQRYKVFWGGRGSGKSWAVAEALIRRALLEPIRVLCTREFQVSIKHSSHKVLKDMIFRLGVQSQFRITQEGIYSRAGAEFIFKGLHNNEQGIRSMEGIDICWVEEAQSVGGISWRALTPTVFRKEDAHGNSTSEIWVTYNLINETDATHHRFVIQGRRGAFVCKVNYDSNTYFPAGLREEMEDDKATDYHLYEHVWLGMALRASDAMVYGNKYRVETFSDNLWQRAEKLFFGLDFGFAQDPNALERFFILDRTLYVDHEAYGVGVELDDLPEFLDRVPGVRDWHIKADCSAPAQISHIRRRGFGISGAEKWDGCIKDGIKHIRKFEQIIIHPRCAGLASEAPLYRYKVDSKAVDERGQPLVLPIVVDKYNHGWDAIRYGLDGHIQRSGEIGMWERLGNNG